MDVLVLVCSREVQRLPRARATAANQELALLRLLLRQHGERSEMGTAVMASATNACMPPSRFSLLNDVAGRFGPLTLSVNVHLHTATAMALDVLVVLGSRGLWYSGHIQLRVSFHYEPNNISVLVHVILLMSWFELFALHEYRSYAPMMPYMRNFGSKAWVVRCGRGGHGWRRLLRWLIMSCAPPCFDEEFSFSCTCSYSYCALCKHQSGLYVYLFELQVFFLEGHNVRR